MPRGGARPGAGRKPKLKPGEATSAKVAPQAFTAAGVKTAAAPADWPFGTAPPTPSAPDTAAPPAPPARPELGSETPLEVMLRIMRESVDPRTQLAAAQLAAPYMHAKPLPAGKKDAKADAAKAASNRFATTAPPRLVSSR